MKSVTTIKALLEWIHDKIENERLAPDDVVLVRIHIPEFCNHADWKMFCESIAHKVNDGPTLPPDHLFGDTNEKVSRWYNEWREKRDSSADDLPR